MLAMIIGTEHPTPSVCILGCGVAVGEVPTKVSTQCSIRWVAS